MEKQVKVIVLIIALHVVGHSAMKAKLYCSSDRRWSALHDHALKYYAHCI
jgi:hypothetical protein